ncbi:hypothetical protein ACFLTQ_02420 [Chloroflexota bacterium]
MRNKMRSVLKTFNNGERGMILHIVMIMLLLVGLMIPPLMSLISTSLVTGQMYENNSYELYAADAGVMDATWFLQELHGGLEGLKDPEKTLEQQEQIEGAITNLFSKYDPDITQEQIDTAIASLFSEEGTYTYGYTLPEEINGKTVTIEIVRDGYLYIITSTATGIDGSTTTVETRVQFPPPPPPIMMAAGALNGNLKINADVGTEDEWVSIYANGDIEMIGSGQIYGDAYYTAGHTVTPPTAGAFHGRAIETVELDLVKGVLPNRPTTIVGSVTIDEPGEYELGPVYILGNLMISGDDTLESVMVELKGTVWVSGKIQINDDAVVYGTYDEGDIPLGMSEAEASYLYSKYEIGDPYFMVSDHAGNGNGISVNGNTPPVSQSGHEHKINAIMYAPDGDIYVGGNAKIKGSVVGKSVTILGDSELTFPLPFEPVEPVYQPMMFNYWKVS